MPLFTSEQQAGLACRWETGRVGIWAPDLAGVLDRHWRHADTQGFHESMRVFVSLESGECKCFPLRT